MAALVNLAEYEAAAREAVDSSILDYFDGGSNDEITLRDNVAAFSRITLYPRMFRGVGTRDTSTTVVVQPGCVTPSITWAWRSARPNSSAFAF